MSGGLSVPNAFQVSFFASWWPRALLLKLQGFLFTSAFPNVTTWDTALLREHLKGRIQPHFSRGEFSCYQPLPMGIACGALQPESRPGAGWVCDVNKHPDALLVLSRSSWGHSWTLSNSARVRLQQEPGASGGTSSPPCIRDCLAEQQEMACTVSKAAAQKIMIMITKIIIIIIIIMKLDYPGKITLIGRLPQTCLGDKG